MRYRKQTISYLCLAGISLIWGTTFLALRIGVTHFPPFLFVAIRQTIAGGAVIGYFLVFKRDVKQPSLKQMPILSLLSFLLITLGNGLVAYAEVTISSGMAAIISSLLPILMIGLNFFINKTERPNMRIMVGMLMGLFGILVIFSEYLTDLYNPSYTLGMSLMFLSVCAWTLSNVLAKRKNLPLNRLLATGWQIFLGGGQLFIFSLLFDNYHGLHWNSSAIEALIYLILVGSIIAMSMYTYVLWHLPLSIGSLYTYINPIIALLLGWLILDEKLTVAIALGFGIIITGVYLVNSGGQQLKR